MVTDDHVASRSGRPTIPPFLTLPLKLVPGEVHSRVLVAALNHLFRRSLAQGELDFIESRTVQIELQDAGVEFRFTMGRSALLAHTGAGPVDLVISGDLYDFVQLALGREDPDTLFFQRRIRLKGSVELGLEVKNFLYALDVDSLSIPQPLRQTLERWLRSI